jgi:hypothetical protein
MEGMAWTARARGVARASRPLGHGRPARWGMGVPPAGAWASCPRGCGGSGTLPRQRARRPRYVSTCGLKPGATSARAGLKIGAPP